MARARFNFQQWCAQVVEILEENPASMPVPRRPKFNERKATQIAARLLCKAGNRLPYMSLLKLMYFTDREAIKRWRYPLTNDKYYSMNFGPVMSRVYDLIVGDIEHRGYWAAHISSPTAYNVELIAPTGSDQLSRAEERLIDEIYEKYGHLDKWVLSKKSHQLPEWTFPDGSSIPIEIEDILLNTGAANEDEADAIAREIRASQTMQSLPE